MSANNLISSFEYLTLLAIIELGINAYGATIRRELADATKKDIAQGAVYTVLKTLTRKGFIKRVEGEPISERGGRSRIYYTIQAPGMKVKNDYENSILQLGGFRPVFEGGM